MKLLNYARVSTKDQNVDQMAEHNKLWAKNNGHEIVWTIKDKESARKPLNEREEFKKIINNHYNFEYDGVLVQDLDRTTRNWEDVTTVEKYFRSNWDKVKLVSTRDNVDLATPTGRLTFRMLMAIAVCEVEKMIVRQSIGIARAQKEGKYKGGKKGRRWAK